MIGPDAGATAVALNVALEAPWETVTMGGTVRAALALVRLMDKFPAVFESETTQVATPFSAIVAGEHERDESLGVDHSDTLAFRAEEPRVAVTTAWLSVGIVPAVATAVPVALAAGMVRLAGTASTFELEFSATVVAAATG